MTSQCCVFSDPTSSYPNNQASAATTKTAPSKTWIKTTSAFRSPSRRRLRPSQHLVVRTCPTSPRSQPPNMFFSRSRQSRSYRCTIHRTSCMWYSAGIQTLSTCSSSCRNGPSTRPIASQHCRRSGFTIIWTMLLFNSAGSSWKGFCECWFSLIIL